MEYTGVIYDELASLMCYVLKFFLPPIFFSVPWTIKIQSKALTSQDLFLLPSVCLFTPPSYLQIYYKCVSSSTLVKHLTKKLDLEILKTSAKCTTANINVALNRKQLKFNNNGEK